MFPSPSQGAALRAILGRTAVLSLFFLPPAQPFSGAACFQAGSAAGAAAAGAAAPDDALRTHAERTRFEETSRLEHVAAFLDALAARSDLVRVAAFGASEAGRPLLVAALSNPPVGHPRDLRALDRPVVLLQANIHGGEVEGKEAVQNLMRRLALGDLRPLLDRVVVLVVPIYNVDGNEALSVENRTAQYGPAGGVGRRENARGLDLNRDYMKLESAEARALVRLYAEWDPHVVVDLHTTNGSYHGYHLTYSIPLNRTLDPKLLDYHRGRLMPAIRKALLDGHGFRTYYYGNFSGPAPKPGGPETRTWRAFDHRPRAGQNYVGFRNRLTVLSEAYSYLDFPRRIAVSEALCVEILRYAGAHGREIAALTRSLDVDFVQRARGAEELPLGVAYELRPLPKPVPILVGEVRRELNPRSGREMTVMVPDRVTTAVMQDFAEFYPTRTVPMARAYALPRDERMRPVVAKLRQHGVAVEELTSALESETAVFDVRRLSKAPRPFQGHHEVRAEGSYSVERSRLPAGTIVVRLAQPLGRLAAYLLEPESDDGLVNWNFLDAALQEGKPAPIRKILRSAPMATRRLEEF